MRFKKQVILGFLLCLLMPLFAGNEYAIKVQAPNLKLEKLY